MHIIEMNKGDPYVSGLPSFELSYGLYKPQIYCRFWHVSPLDSSQDISLPNFIS